MTPVEYAKSQGFIDAVRIGKWNGLPLYRAEYEKENIQPTDNPGEISFSTSNIGYPQFILEKDGRFRMADYDEAMKIYHVLE